MVHAVFVDMDVRCSNNTLAFSSICMRLGCNPEALAEWMKDVCMWEQIADFGMSRVLENNMTHVSTNTHGESDRTLFCSPTCLNAARIATKLL